ncbi:MAG: hypothetical protein HZB44_07710 [Actinobacteria bacterium]|nr:hypothetical protein [Actinomycetota bacterium]
MKNKPLLLWGLGAGIIALVVFIVGYAFVWPVDDDEGCRMSRDRKCAMTKDGGDGGMMGDDCCGMMKMMEGMMGEDGMMGEGGMMGMMGNMMSGGMMGGPVDAATAPISIDQAADAARKYVADQGGSDLKVTRILEFTNGFYARVGETGTGTGAYELKIDRNSGAVSRSMGPGMMWNKKYKGGMMDMMSGMEGMSGMMDMMEMMGGMEGMMGEGGMMGCMKGDDEDDSDDNGMEGMDHGSMSGGDMEGMDHGSMSGDDMSGMSGTGNMDGMEGMGNMSGMDGMSGMMDMMGSVDSKVTTADMTIKPADASSRAQKYADTQFPGSRISSPDVFYGYYTVDIVKDGRVLALLSVNGYSGQVWIQAWPGTYLGGKSL